MIMDTHKLSISTKLWSRGADVHKMAYSLIIFTVLFGTAFAEVVKIKSCSDTYTNCTVPQVRISPCPTYKQDKCVFKKGSEGTKASMSFDLTPDFTTSNLKTMVYWNNGFTDLAFPDMGSDNACEYTTCPTTAGVTQQFQYELVIGSKLPKGTYVFKWKVWDDDNDSQFCCFLTTVQIKR